MRRCTATVLTIAAFSWHLVAVAAPPAGETAALRSERPGKPTGPIVVEHRLGMQPAVGVSVKIAVTARVAGDVGGLNIEATATVPSAAIVSAPLLIAAADGEYEWEITVVPLAVDAGYLSVIVSGSIDGVAQARSVTIPLRGAALPEAAVTAEGAEALIALPVQESP
jgi:hypothetical protein